MNAELNGYTFRFTFFSILFIGILGFIFLMFIESKKGEKIRRIVEKIILLNPVWIILILISFTILFGIVVSIIFPAPGDPMSMLENGSA